jgi:HK97 family phage major capsid protein
MANRLVEKRQEYDAKHKKLMAVHAEAGTDHDVSKIKSLEGDDAAKLNVIAKMNAELKGLEAEIDGLVKMEESEKDTERREKDRVTPADGALPQPQAKGEIKDLGHSFAESAAYKAFRANPTRNVGAEIPVDLKTTITTAAGWAPQSLRTGLVVPFPRREFRILDIVPVGPTGQAAVVYMEETVRTNTAVEITESTGAAVEATLLWAQRSQTVENVGVYIPVTDQQLEDVEQVASVINVELTSMLRERIDSQILNGTGVTPLIAGINVTAHAAVQSVVLAGDRLDAIYNIIKRVRVTGRAVPNFVVMHPNDWETIRLMKTDDGLYKMGNPIDAGVERVWGTPVIQTDACTEGSVLAGAFDTWCKLWEKRGVLIEVTDSHGTDFIHFVKEIRASVRVAMTVTRPLAFCWLTGF